MKIDKQTAEQIVETLLHDLADRYRLGSAWEELKEDIQAKIKAEWVSLVLSHN